MDRIVSNTKKALLFNVPKTGSESFRVQLDNDAYFYPIRHYHPELQVTLILESSGNYFIGDSIGTFSPGDIFIIGSNIPHVFRNEPEYYKKNSSKRIRAISIYLKKEAFGSSFFNLPETQPIESFITKANRGYKISENNIKIKKAILNVYEREGFERLLKLFNLLHLLSHFKELKALSTSAFHTPVKDSDNKRISDVFEFMTQYYNQPVTLSKIAQVANMSPNAFCRYFKKRTRKRYSEVLNEIRIGQACKKLQTDDKGIGEIAFECGYNNLSNFNRQFYRITGVTPSDYKTKL